MAWCRGRCRKVRLWSGDGERTLEPPGRLRADLRGAAALSPDGGSLALPVRGSGGAHVGVIDLATGDWTVIGRTAGYEPVAWSPSGRWLYFTGTRHRLWAWRVGATRPVRLPVRPGGTVMSIATTTEPVNRRAQAAPLRGRPRRSRAETRLGT